jgi:signal transduction histidine kinase
MYSHLAGQQVRMEKKNEVENSLEIIQRSADEMISKLNDIVWFVNPQQDSLKKLVEKVEEYAETIASAKNILISASIPAKIENVKLPMENRRNIYLIFKEAINNAVKYSEASLLELSVQANETVVEFFIKDNGKGFDEKIIKKGNGLENMQKRADEIGAKLILSSKKNEGTSLLLQCKIT